MEIDPTLAMLAGSRKMPVPIMLTITMTVAEKSPIFLAPEPAIRVLRDFQAPRSAPIADRPSSPGCRRNPGERARLSDPAPRCGGLLRAVRIAASLLSASKHGTRLSPIPLAAWPDQPSDSPSKGPIRPAAHGPTSFERRLARDGCGPECSGSPARAFDREDQRRRQPRAGRSGSASSRRNGTCRSRRPS